LQILPHMAWYAELSKLTNGVNLPFKSSEKMSEVMEASVYARGTSTLSKEKFKGMATAAFMSGDDELIGTYKSLSKLMDDDK